MTALTPCALYLRYSSDRQNERSPEDQEAVCRPFMERLGFFIVAVYVDRAKSGATVHERGDFQRMLADARAGAFKAVCAEMTSRYGRDEEDRAAARKRLTFAGVTIYTAADGQVSRLIDGIKAAVDANDLENIKLMVRRGLAAVVRDGRFAGGEIYGYASVPKLPDEKRGELAIDPSQAAIVRRIFAEYVGGASCRTIAGRLNAEGVPAPRRGFWRASTINGHRKRKTGILQNEIYCGRLVWNRAYRVRDPDTAQRVWRYRPESEWQRSEAPALRIIDDALFDEAQRQRVARANTNGWSARPRRLLSGLLRCGACGGGMARKDIDHGRPRIVCSRMLEAHACANRRRYYLDDIEARVIGGLREQLGSPEAIDYLVERYNAERKALRGASTDRRQAIEKELADIVRKIARAVQAIVDGKITEAEAAAHLPALRSRRAALEAERANLDAGPIRLDPRGETVTAYLAELAQLEQRGGADSEAGRTIRAMLETVTVEAAPAPETPLLTVAGELAPLIAAKSSYAGDWGGAGWADWPQAPQARVPFSLILGLPKAA